MARVFSGIQPSGELHIGNYLGAVKHWVELQDRYESFVCIVDYHAITIPYAPDDLRMRTREMAIALFAAGLDPERCTVFVQSRVPEHTELAWIFNTVTPLGELERQTQFKEKASRQESVVAGLLNYPILQAADITLYRADLVPVGEDQLQHLELAREIVRRWTARFQPHALCAEEDGTVVRGGLFPEPQPLLTPTRRVMGLDGQGKMSKSRGNTIGLLEDSASIWNKLRPAVTDPKRIRRQDPGTPEVCNIYHLHRAFSDAATVEYVAQQCRSAGWGCLDCKRLLHQHIDAELSPIRDRAAALRGDPGRVAALLDDGAERARGIARDTMAQVKQAMGVA